MRMTKKRDKALSHFMCDPGSPHDISAAVLQDLIGAGLISSDGFGGHQVTNVGAIRFVKLVERRALNAINERGAK